MFASSGRTHLMKMSLQNTSQKYHLRLCFARLERGSTIGHAAMG